ncbi:MAG: hypothetical protein WGN25_11260 [Candidatus Electrothrix sp. GW3-4]|uniref:hypothetical protein n=1 Tax=Candidatus Electrothrix sp. GW3-4 TaxID=3126740 RepID=UPI0030CE3C67
MEKQKWTFCCCCCIALLLPLLLIAPCFAEEGGDELGKTLVEKKCTICHSIDRVYGAEKNHSEWKQTVEKMMRYSDQMNFLNQKEKKTVIEFLAYRKTAQADSEQ